MNKRQSLTIIGLWICLESGPIISSSQGADLNSDRLIQEQIVTKGPWGDLKYFPLTLEPTDYYTSLMTELKTWLEGTIWRFHEPDAQSVARVMVASGLNPELAARLTSDEFLRKGELFLEVRPPDEVIEGLTSEQRASLYLHFQPAEIWNPFYQPFTLMPGGISSHAIASTGIAPELLVLIDKLCYRRGQSIRFADITYVLGKAGNDDERFRIVKTLCREISLNVHIQLSDNSDLTQLANYWGSGGRNKEILPLLESVVRTPGVEKLDLIHLLPPTPRKLLHTYPSPNGPGLPGDLPDCYWTSFSFFSDEPPDRHLDFVGHVFSERYERAPRPLQFGDLILIFESDTQNWVHACNYLASDLVFTKNGKSLGRPWSIARLEEVVASYFKTEKLSISFFRLKPEYRR